MAVSDHWHRVSKVRATIMAVDPKNNIIDVRRGDGGPQRIMVWEVPDAFIWPKDGEDWSIYEQNGSWYLGERINSPIDDIPITSLRPGDQRLGGTRTIAREIQIQSEDEVILDLYDTGGPVDRKRSRLVNADGFTYLQAPDDEYDEILTTGFAYNHSNGHVLFEHGATTDASATTAISEETTMQVRDVGSKNQVRSGRQLDWVKDFVDLGIDPPAIWNLGGSTDITGAISHIGVDSSAGSFHLTNRNGGVSLGSGITGEINTAAVFHGSVNEALFYELPTHLNASYGARGCWFRTAKRGVNQALMSQYRTGSGQHFWHLGINTTNQVHAIGSVDGVNDIVASGGPDVCDDRWHFAVVVFDGTFARVYVDTNQIAEVALEGPLYASATLPLNIGGFGADAITTAQHPFFGSIDEAFLSRNVLTADQVRFLYAARIPHEFPETPARASVNVRKRRRGGQLLTTDFSIPPKYLYTFGGWNNAGTGAGTVSGVVNPAYGPAGFQNGRYFDGVSTSAFISAPSSDLPHSIAARSAGCWFKCHAIAPHTGSYGLIGLAGIDIRYLYISGGSRTLAMYDSVTPVAGGPIVADGLWHHAVSVFNNSAADSVPHKLYLDGRLVASHNVGVAATIAPTGLLIGKTDYVSGTEYFPGIISDIFLCDYALTAEQVHAIYDHRGSSGGLPPQPKDPADHIVALYDNSILVNFDSLNGCDTVDVRVAA